MPDLQDMLSIVTDLTSEGRLVWSIENNRYVVDAGDSRIELYSEDDDDRLPYILVLSGSSGVEQFVTESFVHEGKSVLTPRSVAIRRLYDTVREARATSVVTDLLDGLGDLLDG